MYSKYCSNIYCFSIQFVKSTCYILSRIEPCLFLVLHMYIVVLPFPDIPFMIHNVFKYSTFNLKFEDNMNQISNISITTITIFTNIFEQLPVALCMLVRLISPCRLYFSKDVLSILIYLKSEKN